MPQPNVIRFKIAIAFPSRRVLAEYYPAIPFRRLYSKAPGMLELSR
ncbi:MAG TPA: hypothetical protein VM689_05845 [Aliidongia sp.]|nr:hypothetical protein [Aliidongia sp.]